MTISPLFFEYIVKEEHYSDGDMINEEGSSGNWISVVLEGQVKIKKQSPKGSITLMTLKEGNAFGELVFFETVKETRFMSVTAVGNVVVGILDTERLTIDLNTLSPRLKKLIACLMRKRRESTNKLIQMLVGTG